MKKIQPYLLTLLVTMLLFQDMAADTRNRRIQQGYVRTQSFFNKKSEPLPDVMIILDDEQLNRSTAGGYFEINLDNHEDTFRIDSVFYPKDKNIRLLSSIMMREYVFSETNPVILIMMDEKELERQIEYATEGAIASIKEKYEIKLKKILEDHALEDKKRQELIDKLGQEMAMMQEQQRKNARNFLSGADYETADSLKKAIWEAIYMGDFEKVDSLNRLRGTIEGKAMQLEGIRSKRQWELDMAKSAYEAAEKYRKEEEHILNELIDMVRTSIIVATQQVKISDIQGYYEILMKYNPEDVEIFIEAGEFAENFLCDLEAAEAYYKQAVLSAGRFDFDKTNLADSYLHIGNLYNLLGWYDEAIYYMKKALEVCDENEDKRIKYQTYLSIANWENSWGSKAEASKKYECCLEDKVKENFPNEYTLASIAKASSLMESGNIKEANAILSNIPDFNENSINITDVGTVINTKVAHMVYLLACYKAKEALEYCEKTEKLLKNVLSGDNHYTVSILVCKARILAELNDFEGCSECINKAISITRNIFGEEHPTYINLLTSSAEQLIGIGEFRLVEERLLKVIESIENQKYGTQEHTLRARLALVNLYSEMYESSKMLEQIQICEEIIANSELNNEQVSEKLNFLKYNLSGESGDLKKCLESSLRSAELAKREIGDKCNELAIAYVSVAKSYISLQDTEKCIEYLKKALELYKDLYGKTDIRTMMVEVQYLILTTENERKELDNTLAYIKKTEEALINTLGENNLALSQVYEPLIGYYSNSDDITKAREYAQKNLDIVEHTYGKGHKKTISALKSLSACYSSEMRFREAEEYINQAIEITEREFGLESEMMAMCLSARINLYISEGNAKEAYLSIEELEEILLKKAGKKSLPYAELLIFKSKTDISSEEKGKLLHEVLDIYKQHHDEGNHNFINIHLALAYNYTVRHDFNKAEEHLKLASELVRTIYGEGSISEGKVLLGYCNLYIEQDAYEKASDAIKRIKKIESRHNIANNFELALYESKIHLSMGQTDKALDAIMAANEEVRKKYGNGSIWECKFLNKLAEIYLSISEVEKATAYLKRSIEISSTELANDQNYNSAAYTGLAAIYMTYQPTTESCNEARSIFRKVKLQTIKSLGSSHGFIGELDMYLGQCDLVLYGLTHNSEYLKSARKYMESGKDIIADFYKDQVNTSLIGAHMWLANAMSYTGEVYPAINNYNKALDYSKQLYGEDNINTVNPIISLGNAYAYLGQTDKALEYYGKAIDIIEASEDKNEMMLMSVMRLKANTYELKEEYESAMSSLMECIGMLESHGEGYLQAILDCQMQLTRVCARIGDSEKVKEHILKMLDEMAQTNSMTPMQIFNMGYLCGNLLLQQVGDLDKAEECLLMAEAEIPNIEDLLDNNEYQIYYSLAKTYEFKEDRTRYKEYLKKAYKTARKCSNIQKEQLDFIKEELQNLFAK